MTAVPSPTMMGIVKYVFLLQQIKTHITPKITSDIHFQKVALSWSFIFKMIGKR